MKELTSIDRKFLFELSKDVRGSANELATRSNISRDQVQSRIEKFAKSGLILRFHPLIPLDRLGITHHVTRLKLRSASEELENKMVEHLVSHPSTTWVAKTEGRFHIAYATRCFHPTDAADFQLKLLNTFHDIIIDRNNSLYVQGEFFTRDYLINRKTRGNLTIKTYEQFKRLDHVDFKILECLSISARKTSAEICRELIESKTVPSFSREAVSYRIKNLENNGWINGYWLVLNPKQRSILYCKIEIRLDQVSHEELSTLLAFCRTHPRVISMLRLIGSWDYELDLELDDYKQGKEFIMELTKILPNAVKDYDLTMVSSIEKWGYPSILANASSHKFK